jgi:acetyl-CoA carboxylase biotin carboxyl carrier protein
VDLSSEDVQEILQLLDGLPYGEMHLQTPRFSLWLRRAPDGEWTQEMQVLSGPAMAAAPEPGADGADRTAGPGAAAGAGETGLAGAARSAGATEVAGASGETAAGGAEVDGLRPVCAPLPGTFYRAPMPGAPPFVEVGSRVEPDTVVGIVETMKLMNSVPAGVGGTVAEILLGNAEFAERDAVLRRIREDP